MPDMLPRRKQKSRLKKNGRNIRQGTVCPQRPNGHSAGEPTEKPKEKSAKPPSEGKTENKEAQIQAEGIREEPPAAPENPEGRTFYNVEEDEPFDRDEEASLPPEQPPVKNPSDYVPDGWGEKR